MAGWISVSDLPTSALSFSRLGAACWGARCGALRSAISRRTASPAGPRQFFVRFADASAGRPALLNSSGSVPMRTSSHCQSFGCRVVRLAVDAFQRSPSASSRSVVEISASAWPVSSVRKAFSTIWSVSTVFAASGVAVCRSITACIARPASELSETKNGSESLRTSSTPARASSWTRAAFQRAIARSDSSFSFARPSSVFTAFA